MKFKKEMAEMLPSELLDEIKKHIRIADDTEKSIIAPDGNFDLVKYKDSVEIDKIPTMGWIEDIYIECVDNSCMESFNRERILEMFIERFLQEDENPITEEAWEEIELIVEDIFGVLSIEEIEELTQDYPSEYMMFPESSLVAV